MTDRDKLIELLKKADENASRKLIMDYNDAIADNAEYLLANGVIVPPCKVGELTDNAIKKALECCIKSSHFGECFENECPMVSEEGCKVGKETLYPYALDLINRFEARIGVYETCNARKDEAIKYLESEVKKLQSENERLKKGWTADVILTADTKAEAYKEFAERLCEDRVSNDPVVIAAKCLLKEMESEQK